MTKKITKNIEGAVDTSIRPASKDEAFESAFFSLLESSKIEKEVWLGEVKFTVVPLSTQEYLESEAIFIANFKDQIPKDVIDRARMVSNLSYAIIAINDIPIFNSETDESRKKVREALYNRLTKLPPTALDVIHNTYREAVNEQAQVFVKAEDLIENF